MDGLPDGAALVGMGRTHVNAPARFDTGCRSCFDQAVIESDALHPMTRRLDRFRLLTSGTTTGPCA
jgi:hypothetical protein